jgi:hypothetical protein
MDLSDRPASLANIEDGTDTTLYRKVASFLTPTFVLSLRSLQALDAVTAESSKIPPLVRSR